MRKKAFKDGVLLRNMIEDFNQEKSTEKMVSILLCFRDSDVLIPHLAGTNHIDLLNCDGHIYLPAFSNQEQMASTYDDSFDPVSYEAIPAIELAAGIPDVEGILIDGFTNPFMIPRDLFGFVLKQESHVDESPEEALLEVGRMSTEQLVKVAVAYDQENGRVFQHFGHSEAFKIYSIENSDVVHSEIISTQGQGHSALAAFLASLKINFLLCGGIGSGAIKALEASGIQIFGGVDDDADDAVNELLAGILLYDPDVECNHHGEGGCDCSEHGEGGCGCGEHGEGGCGCSES